MLLAGCLSWPFKLDIDSRFWQAQRFAGKSVTFKLASCGGWLIEFEILSSCIRTCGTPLSKNKRGGGVRSTLLQSNKQQHGTSTAETSS